MSTSQKKTEAKSRGRKDDLGLTKTGDQCPPHKDEKSRARWRPKEICFEVKGCRKTILEKDVISVNQQVGNGTITKAWSALQQNLLRPLNHHPERGGKANEEVYLLSIG